MICRGCGNPELSVFLDLGAQPIANALLTTDQGSEVFHPLKAMLCDRCLLVQLGHRVSPRELFADRYPYFSSQSAAFVEHARDFVEDACDRFGLTETSLVVEIASNDGYLLQHVNALGIRCYGIEPAEEQAKIAITRGIPTLIEFFDANLVCDTLIPHGSGEFDRKGDPHRKADLIIANNVLAHVPELHGFLQGVRLLLAKQGVFTVEVQWLHDLIEGCEVGQIYHEHFSYFLLASLEYALGLTNIPMRVFDVELLPEIHGGSVRFYACHEGADHATQDSVGEMRRLEADWLGNDPLHNFGARAAALKLAIWEFLIEEHRSRHLVVGYAAAAKAAGLLSWAGVTAELLPFVVDTTPAKQGTFLPGSRIPIVGPERLDVNKPTTIWILAPNHVAEIIPKLREQCKWKPYLVWQDGCGVNPRTRAVNPDA